MNEPPLDVLDSADLVSRLLSAQQHVAAVVHAASGELAEAAELLATVVASGGRIVLIGAGTSGRLAAMEAAELPGTFGLAPDRIVGRVAGATPELPYGADGAEDDAALGRSHVSDLGVGAGDAVIAVAASGTTPYTLAAAAAARAAGAHVVAVVNVPGSALSLVADIAVELPTGPEVLLGSTRLAAGTAQKLALNTMTTAAMVRAGRVHGRFMVDVVPANDKLIHRVTDLVAESCGVDGDTAASALRRCGGNARAAIVHLLTGVAPDEARRRAAAHRTVREAVDSAG